MSIPNPRLTQAIEQHLQETGKKKQEFLDDAGISNAYLWQLENGVRENPSDEYLNSIADALGKDAEYLFGEWRRQVREYRRSHPKEKKRRKQPD